MLHKAKLFVVFTILVSMGCSSAPQPQRTEIYTEQVVYHTYIEEEEEPESFGEIMAGCLIELTAHIIVAAIFGDDDDDDDHCSKKSRSRDRKRTTKSDEAEEKVDDKPEIVRRESPKREKLEKRK